MMSIMTIVLSLVGPLTLKMIDRAQAQSELIAFKNSINKVSYIAFASATEFRFELAGKQVSVYRAGDMYQQTQFEYLTFTAQQVTFNSRGYPTPESIKIALPQRTEDINLFRLIEGVDAKIN